MSRRRKPVEEPKGGCLPVLLGALAFWALFGLTFFLVYTR